MQSTFLDQALAGLRGINSWMQYERLAGNAVKQTICYSDNSTKVTVYKPSGWDIDWQGNACRVWAKVA